MTPPSCSLRGSGCNDGGGGGRDWRVLLPTGRGLEGAGVRGFGVVDSVQDKIINRNTAKQGARRGLKRSFYDRWLLMTRWLLLTVGCCSWLLDVTLLLVC